MMLNAMPDAYANAMPGALHSPQCTDGRTNGQDVEPPHLRDHLPLCDACETDGEKFAEVAHSLVEARLRYYGYDDEWIRAHEEAPNHRAFGCELTCGGWDCFDHDRGEDIHPDHDEYQRTAEWVTWVLDELAAHPTPADPTPGVQAGWAGMRGPS